MEAWITRHAQPTRVRQFLAACATGDPTQLTAMLSQDAVLYSDGGGKVSAAINPIVGADRVARFLIGVGKKLAGVSVQFADVNGETGAVLLDGGRAFSVMGMELDAESRISGLYFVTNPDKLREI
jgi:hypothetical protein